VRAVGSGTNDFGVRGPAENCLCLDDREQADRFRSKLLNHCLRVSRRMSAEPESDEHVKIVMVGGAATGAERSAELFNAASALRHYGLEVLDEDRLQVPLIEAGPRLLPALPEKLAAAAKPEAARAGRE